MKLVSKKLVKKLGGKVGMKIFKLVSSKMGKKIMLKLLRKNPKIMALTTMVEIGLNIAM